MSFSYKLRVLFLLEKGCEVIFDWLYTTVYTESTFCFLNCSVETGTNKNAKEPSQENTVVVVGFPHFNSLNFYISISQHPVLRCHRKKKKGIFSIGQNLPFFWTAVLRLASWSQYFFAVVLATGRSSIWIIHLQSHQTNIKTIVGCTIAF